MFAQILFLAQELIKKHGAKNYNFHQYRAHYHGIIRKVDKTYNPFYEPPGYHADIAFGVYQPDSQKPQVKLLLSITFFLDGQDFICTTVVL